MKLTPKELICLCIIWACVSAHGAHSSEGKPHRKCGFKHNLLPEIGVSEEHPDDVANRKLLYYNSHRFKVHVDASNVRTNTDEQREYLLKVVAEQGNKIFADKIGISGSQRIRGNPNIERYCTYGNIVTVPDRYLDYYSSTNADFILLLATEDGEEGTLAYASACYSDRDTGRPIIGLAVFNNAYLDPSKGTLDNDVATYVHEVLHALVFSSQLFKKFPKVREFPEDPDSKLVPQYVVSNGMHYLRGTNLLKVTRDHFDCQDISVIPLEDNGGEGSVGGHFERVIFGDETMVAEDVSIAKFSKITLALLKDSGWYDIDLSKGDLWTWGKGEGCELFSKTCSNSSIEETCDRNNNFGCDKTFHFKMSCQSTGFTNGCKIKALGERCTHLQKPYFFESTNINSRCQELTYNGAKFAGCVDVACSRSKTRYQVSLGGKYPTKFICDHEGQSHKPWKGYEFFCENPKLICRDLCPKGCYERGKCLENGQCMCDPLFEGEICGTFNRCPGLSRNVCYAVINSNNLDTKSYSNSYGQADFDPDYLRFSSWTDFHQRSLVETDSGL